MRAQKSSSDPELERVGKNDTRWRWLLPLWLLLAQTTQTSEGDDAIESGSLEGGDRASE
jgi:hypothetical protein